MDCVLLSSHLTPHNFVNTRYDFCTCFVCAKGLWKFPRTISSWFYILFFSVCQLTWSSFRFQQGCSGLNSIGIAVIRKGCLKLRCYAIGDELGGSGQVNQPFNKSNNGSVFQGLNASGASFRTVGAEITQETGDFFVSDAEGDPDKPTDGFSSIDQAINALREGKVGEWLY
jgi:3,4-dihydroxy 2-butanone 4-phosphate synthase/GTP cyclohydrolase II